MVSDDRMPKATEHLESPVPWDRGRGIAEGLGEEEDGYKCPLNRFPRCCPCLPPAGKFLALHRVTSVVCLCWSRLWKYVARAAQGQPFCTWQSCFQLSSTKDGRIATSAFFHIKVAVRAPAEEAALFFLHYASWTA